MRTLSKVHLWIFAFIFFAPVGIVKSQVLRKGTLFAKIKIPPNKEDSSYYYLEMKYGAKNEMIAFKKYDHRKQLREKGYLSRTKYNEATKDTNTQYCDCRCGDVLAQTFMYFHLSCIFKDTADLLEHDFENSLRDSLTWLYNQDGSKDSCLYKIRKQDGLYFSMIEGAYKVYDHSGWISERVINKYLFNDLFCIEEKYYKKDKTLLYELTRIFSYSQGDLSTVSYNIKNGKINIWEINFKNGMNYRDR